MSLRLRLVGRPSIDSASGWITCSVPAYDEPLLARAEGVVLPAAALPAALVVWALPGLGARRDLGTRASVAWKLPWARLEAGGQILRAEDAWLPMVLPSPEACAAAGGQGSPPG